MRFKLSVALQNHHYETRSTTFKHDTPNGSYRAPLVAYDGNTVSSFGHDTTANKLAHDDDMTLDRSGPGILSRSYSNEEDTPDTMADQDVDYDDDERHGRSTAPSHKRNKEADGDTSEEDSKWIHRDKLAKIESEELQAAGFILPQPRSRSQRRDRSQSSHKRLAGGSNGPARSRRDSAAALEPKTPDASAAINGWADEGDQPARPTTGSRIPVPKKSPMLGGVGRSRENSPEDLEKRLDTAPKARSRSNSTTLKSLEPSPSLKATPAKRSNTDATAGRKPVTPTATGVRKASAPAKTIPPEARGKVKPKGKGSISSNNGRPSTRSGERELSTSSIGSKPMEGDPPWMVSAYKPDPRLPPDQQLLPTVAKRLAQEKWEQEGKFGNIYDKDFRPLNEDGFLSPPANVVPGGAISSPNESHQDDVVNQEVERSDEWPLKSPEPKSPASLGRSSTYSTMPRIQDNPPVQPPVASPRLPSGPTMGLPPQAVQVTRVPDAEKVENVKGGKNKKDGGCGCCIVM